MTKIAVASSEGQISQHFGFCDTFQIFGTSGEAVLRQGHVANPGHRPGFLPKYLRELGVNVVITGGMGDSASRIFDRYGVTVITGASGDPETAARAYVEGRLVSDGVVCTDHTFAGEHGHGHQRRERVRGHHAG